MFSFFVFLFFYFYYFFETKFCRQLTLTKIERFVFLCSDKVVNYSENLTNTVGSSLNKQEKYNQIPGLNDKVDVTFLVQPGVYEIYDTDTGYSYYGETTSLFNRLNNHKEQLSKGIHDNKECIDAGFATNIQNIRRNIKQNKVGWKYSHLDTRGKPLRTPYALKPGEISYKQWLEHKN